MPIKPKKPRSTIKRSESEVNDGLPVIEPKILAALRGYPTRLTKVNSQAWWRVPRYIYRMDIGYRERSPVGWLVEVPGDPTFEARVFSDSKFGTGIFKGTPHASFKAAMRYLVQAKPYRRSDYLPPPDLDLRPKIYQSEGLKLIKVQPPRSQHEQYFFVITGVPGYRPKRIYIGSTKTITQDRINQRWAYAQELRATRVQGLDSDQVNEV